MAVPRSSGQEDVSPDNDAPSGQQSPVEEPDKIQIAPLPAPAGQNPNPQDPNLQGTPSVSGTESGSPGDAELITKPVGSTTNSPTFIGTALWVAPGTLTSLGNTIWADLGPQT